MLRVKAKKHPLLTAMKAAADGIKHVEYATIGARKFGLQTIGPEASDWMLARASRETENLAGIALIMSSFRPAASIVSIDDVSVYSLFEPEPSSDLTEAQIQTWKGTAAYRNWLRDEVHAALRDIVSVPELLELQRKCAKLDARAEELRVAAQEPDSPLPSTPSNA